jgi:hypothetical protein
VLCELSENAVLANVEAGQDRLLDLRKTLPIDPRRESLPEQRLPQCGATKAGVSARAGTPRSLMTAAPTIKITKQKRKLSMKSLPYASAASSKARDEISKTLQRFGCESVGIMDDYAKHEVVFAFKHRGVAMQLPASAAGWAQMWLKQNPWTHRHRTSRGDYEQAALRQGHIAVNSMLRDWVKAQITIVECGILSFEAVFMPYMLTADGRPLIERLADSDLLPKAQEQKVVALPSYR